MPQIPQKSILPYVENLDVPSNDVSRNKHRDLALDPAGVPEAIPKTGAVGAIAGAAAYVLWKKDIDVSYPPHATLPQYGDPHPGTHFASLKRAWKRRKSSDFIIF